MLGKVAGGAATKLAHESTAALGAPLSALGGDEAHALQVCEDVYKCVLFVCIVWYSIV